MLLSVSPRRLAVARALLALVWAGAVVLAVGDRVPSTDATVPVVAALLVATYPIIDVVASLVEARRRPTATALRVNAAIGALAALGLGTTLAASDAGAVLGVFGTWAVVSGVLQVLLALRGSRRAPILISGGLSTLAGLSFLSAAGMDEAHLAVLGGYMAVGGVLYLASARDGETTAPSPAV